jgi:hypothetical protein
MVHVNGKLEKPGRIDLQSIVLRVGFRTSISFERGPDEVKARGHGVLKADLVGR